MTDRKLLALVCAAVAFVPLGVVIEAATSDAPNALGIGLFAATVCAALWLKAFDLAAHVDAGRANPRIQRALVVSIWAAFGLWVALVTGVL